MSSSTEGKWLCLTHSETRNAHNWHGMAPNHFTKLLYTLISHLSFFLPTLNTTKGVKHLEIASGWEHLQFLAPQVGPSLSLAGATPFHHSVWSSQRNHLICTTPTKSPTQRQTGDRQRPASTLLCMEIGECLQNLWLGGVIAMAHHSKHRRSCSNYWAVSKQRSQYQIDLWASKGKNGLKFSSITVNEKKRISIDCGMNFRD